jgi:hypothetical protein
VEIKGIVLGISEGGSYLGGWAATLDARLVSDRPRADKPAKEVHPIQVCAFLSLTPWRNARLILGPELATFGTLCW